MKSPVLDTLLRDPSIKNLLRKSKDLYWMRPIDSSLRYSQEEYSTICRLGYMLSSTALASGIDDLSYADEAYQLLKEYPIDDETAESVFDSIAGYDFQDKQVIFYFYLASLALKMDKSISARLLLSKYSPADTSEEKNWGLRTLYSVLKSILFLIRKQKGFSDIHQAISLIEQLRLEQKDFENKYVSNLNLEDQRREALSLVGIYHVSKAITDTADFLINGYAKQHRLITSAVRQHIEIAIGLQNNNSRLKDIISIIWNDLQLLIRNSIWNNTGFDDKIKELCKKKAESGILELLPSQQKALESNMLNVAANAIVLQMPTSSGKTLMAEFNILITRSLRSDSKIVYVVPSRALMNQVFFDLREDLSGLDLTVERTSAAIEIDPAENDFLLSEEIDILVTTPEKLDLLIRRHHRSVEDISLFIIDEAHTIENGERGARLELLLTILRRERPDAKYMLLSPFLPEGGEKIKEWLGGGNSIQIDWKPSDKLVFGLKLTRRKVKYTILPTPFSDQVTEEKSFESSKRIATDNSGTKKEILEYVIRQYGEADKTQLILCKGRDTALNQAQFISDFTDCKERTSDDLALIQKYMEEEIGCPTTYTQLLSKGITVHHAGLSDESKILIEHLIRKGEIQYICATTTIAEGVNFPVSSVYFDSFQKGNTTLSTNDFWNIAGRAGRTLIDDIGKIILPFNSKTNITSAKAIISKSADELASVLARLFVERDNVLQKLNSPSGISELEKSFPESFGPLFQYFVHILNMADSEYITDIEDLFKDTLAYHLLPDDRKNSFIDLCRQIYLCIQAKYSTNTGVLKFADKTGFSVPSVLSIMREKSKNARISDLSSWNPDEMFNRNDSSNLAHKISVIAALKETQMGTESKQGPFSPDIVARILTAWVKGDKLNSISTIHPSFINEEDSSKRVASFVKYMNDIRFKASWGLSALEGIVRGNENDIKDTDIPSFVYYGVDDRKALVMRMLGIPRSLSGNISQIIDGPLSHYSFSKLRNQIHTMTANDWDSVAPAASKLSGQEWKRIVNLLMK